MKARHEVLFQQLHAYRRELLELAAEVTEAQAEVIPAGFNNNIRWNLGHIFTDQYGWIHALTQEEQPVAAAFNLWFGYGSSPSSFTTETPSFSELLQMLEQQPAEIQERYRDRLDEEFPPTEMGMHTVEQVLIRTIFHEGLHIGAIQALKRQAVERAQ
ncbi:DinB family protein [Paenibacillus humicus]|uniref:DinB family protein n=1 Tax=Paenibacillus humicus TaxID=412861 RepID=UPI003F138D56